MYNFDKTFLITSEETVACSNKETAEEILDEIECNIYPQGDDTWGVDAECDREYLREYIKAKLYELLEYKNEQQN